MDGAPFKVGCHSKCGAHYFHNLGNVLTKRAIGEEAYMCLRSHCNSGRNPHHLYLLDLVCLTEGFSYIILARTSGFLLPAQTRLSGFFCSCETWYTVGMKKKIIVANWKMYPKTPGDAKKLFTAIKKEVAPLQKVAVCVCPPFVFLPELAKLGVTRKVSLGVQDVAHEEVGAYTGQVSPLMVSAYKAKTTIVGHSERRALGESNAVVAEKVKHAVRAGMHILVCVGEQERSDEGDYYTFIREQLEAVLRVVKKADMKHLSIAYEPVWAIGKSAEEALAPEALYETVLFIRKVVTERFGRVTGEDVAVLYGGSVKVENAKEFVQVGDVDGLLVGSASLDPKQFASICKTIIEQ